MTQGFVFQDAMTSSTRVFGRKDVSVVFAGDSPRTDGSTVYLPALPATAEITPHQGNVIRGYRSHEALHVRLTDTSPPTLRRLGAIGQEDQRVQKIVSFCEDLRIEHAGVLEYPGMRQDLSAVNVHAADVLKEQIEKFAESTGKPVTELLPLAPPYVQLDIAMPAIGRQMNGLELGWYAEAIKHIRPDILAFAKRAAEEAMRLETGVNAKGELVESKSKQATTAAMDLGERLAAEFAALLQEPPPPPPPPEPEPEQGDDESDSDDEGNGKGEGNGGGSDEDQQTEDGEQGEGDGEGDGDGSEGADGNAQGGGNGSAGGDSSEDDGDGDGDSPPDSSGQPGGNGAGGRGQPLTPEQMEKMAKELSAGDFSDALKDVVDDINGTAQAQPADGKPILPWRQFTSRGLVQHNASDLLKNETTRTRNYYVETYDSIRRKIQSKQAMIRRVLEQELQARMDRRWQGGHTSGKLNAGRLVDAVLGKESVYRKREDGRDIDTLLRLHIDASGSMATRDKMVNATQLAIAMCEALERTGCDIAVSSWDYHGTSPEQTATCNAHALHAQRSSLDPNYRPTYTSIGVCDIIHFKTPRERMSHPTTKERFGMLACAANGSTPLVDTLLPAVADMIKQRHGKRILVVMTDGDPNGPIEGHALSTNRAMAEIHETCRKHGIYLLGVGINHKVDHLFSDHVHVFKTDDYAEVMRKIAKHLKQERTNAYRMPNAA